LGSLSPAFSTYICSILPNFPSLIKNASFFFHQVCAASVPAHSLILNKTPFDPYMPRQHYLLMVTKCLINISEGKKPLYPVVMYSLLMVGSLLKPSWDIINNSWLKQQVSI